MHMTLNRLKQSLPIASHELSMHMDFYNMHIPFEFIDTPSTIKLINQCHSHILLELYRYMIILHYTPIILFIYFKSEISSF
jgi:hypothetical protein